MARELTERQQAFVEAYCCPGSNYRNGTQAAIAAGIKASIAPQQASKWLKVAHIAAAIEARTADHREKLAKISAARSRNNDEMAERWLIEVERLAYFDPRNMMNSDGSPKQLAEIDADTAAAIANFEIHELFDGQDDQKHAYGLSRKVGWTDKPRALKMMGDYLGMASAKKLQVTGPGGGPIVMQQRTDADLEHFVMHGRWPGE